jgi:hypothetical protein
MPYLEGSCRRSVEIKRRRRRADHARRRNERPSSSTRIAAEAGEGMAEGTDWASAEIIDVLPSLSGTPEQAGSSDTGE